MSDLINSKSKPTFLNRFLNVIEKVGNALPHPATIFAILTAIVVFLSWLLSELGVTTLHPKDGSPIIPVNLLSQDGLHWVMENTVENYTGFAPLGTVLVAMLGIGVAEKSGLIGSCLRLLVHWAPRRLLTFVLVLTGVMSNMASDVGYVLLVPMGAIIFMSVGRHPIAGLAASFAGVTGGFSANLLLGTIDPLLAGMTEEAARIIDPQYVVTPLCNYYFMSVSTFLIAALGTWITEKVVIPRLGPYTGDGDTEVKSDELHPLTSAEKKGLWWTLVLNLAMVGVIVVGLVPGDGFLRSTESTNVLHSPFVHGIVSFIFLGGLLSGIVYGVISGVFKSDADVIEGMKEAMQTMGLFLVLVFFAAQFVAYFKHTNLGMILAVNGAQGLKASGLGPIPLMLSFIVLSAALNMTMGSASAKWAFMAPVFVPMFMLLGYGPELVQGVYRIGDSTTNMISPMMSFFALIVAYVQRYAPQAGLGTVIATMLPYSVAFTIGWMILLVIWLFAGWPLGPGAGLYLDG